MLKMIGYWKASCEDNYPNPKDFISIQYWEDVSKMIFWRFFREFAEKVFNDEMTGEEFRTEIERWTNTTIEHVAVYLDEHKPCNKYYGFSGCRICGQGLGSFERTDGTYIWPEKLSHYIREHKIMLPSEFIIHTFKGLESLDYQTDFWIHSMNKIISLQIDIS